MSPSPGTNHQRILGRLSSYLHDFIVAGDLGEVFIAPLDVFLNDVNIYQPDIVFVSSANLNKVTEKGIEGAPDLCVEVLSESTQRFDRTTKKKIFAQAGLQHYWLVDPNERAIAVFDLAVDIDSPAVVLAPPEKLRPAGFPDLEIDLATLFARI